MYPQPLTAAPQARDSTRNTSYVGGLAHVGRKTEGSLVHPNQITQWNTELMQRVAEVFATAEEARRGGSVLAAT
jgi:hypothetical protein